MQIVDLLHWLDAVNGTKMLWMVFNRDFIGEKLNRCQDLNRRPSDLNSLTLITVIWPLSDLTIRAPSGCQNTEGPGRHFSHWYGHWQTSPESEHPGRVRMALLTTPRHWGRLTLFYIIHSAMTNILFSWPMSAGLTWPFMLFKRHTCGLIQFISRWRILKIRWGSFPWWVVVLFQIAV